MRIDYDILKKQFEESARSVFSKATEELRKNGVCRIVFPYANEITIEHLKEMEPQMDSLLKECGSLTELMSVLWETFGSIPSMNKNSVNNYALLYAYLHDFDNDADCESLVVDAGIKLLTDSDVNIEKLKDEIKKKGRDAFYRKSIAFFLNQLAEKKEAD